MSSLFVETTLFFSIKGSNDLKTVMAHAYCVDDMRLRREFLQTEDDELILFGTCIPQYVWSPKTNLPLLVHLRNVFCVVPLQMVDMVAVCTRVYT